MTHPEQNKDTSEENTQNINSPTMKTENQNRPKRGLEDWEMLQTREEPPLNVPYWAILLVVGLLIGGVLLSFPLTGIREGYERPWIDSGLFIGLGYGILLLAVIYFILKKRKDANQKSSSDKPN